MTNQNKIMTKVAGTSFREFDWNLIRPGVNLPFKREPENSHDANAIALYVLDGTGHAIQIGYINKHQAEKLAPWLDDDSEPVDMTVTVTEVTGGVGVKKNRGINIQIVLGGMNLSEYFDLSELYGIDAASGLAV
jgi:hypothetical protein